MRHAAREYPVTTMEPPQQPSGTTLYERLGGRPGLALLLRRFYADVRQHQLIGPIFNRTIHDWPAHLEKIADFWSNVTGGPIRYSGPMPFKHLPLGLEPPHFEAWLDLWRRHCRAHLPADAAAELITAAESIGDRIRWIIAAHGGPPPETAPERPHDHG